MSPRPAETAGHSRNSGPAHADHPELPEGSRIFCIVATLLVLLDAASAAGQARAADERAESRAGVASRGADVMPFDLELTSHDFRPLEDGGTQTVVARDPADADQIVLIQRHLREAAERFQRGDFSDPAFIHGADMPGLAEVRQGASRIRIEFAAVPDGAQIRYLTADPALVSAIHQWFLAQTSDHGAHAHP